MKFIISLYLFYIYATDYVLGTNFNKLLNAIHEKNKPEVYTENKSQLESSFKDNISEYKKSLVIIEHETDIKILNQKSSNSLVNGFIIDKELGLIATNKQVTISFLTNHKIKFFDGSTQLGNAVYYDIFHDFGIIQIKNFKNDSKFYENLKAVKMNSSYNLKKNSEIFILENNDLFNNSFMTGNILELNLPNPKGHGSLIQTSFNKTDRLSGIPIWDFNGNIIAIHSNGDNYSSFEIPIDYLVDVYNFIKKTKNLTIERPGENKVNIFDYDKGFIGIEITTISFFKINRLIEDIPKNNKNLEVIKNILNIQKSLQIHSEIPEVIIVQNVMEDSPAFGKIRAGDVLLKVNEDIVGNDLIKYEKTLDSNINKNIKLTVFRFGELLNFYLIVAGTKNEKIKEFLMIKNTIFHDIKLGYRLKYGFIKEGIYSGEIRANSAFSYISYKNPDNYENSNVLLLRLNSKRLSNIKSLIDTFNNLCDRSNIFIEAIDLNVAFSRPEIYPVNLNNIVEISKYSFDEDQGVWKNSLIVLKSCKSKLNHRKIKPDAVNADKKFFHHFYSRMNEMKKFKVHSFKLSPI